MFCLVREFRSSPDEGFSGGMTGIDSGTGCSHGADKSCVLEFFIGLGHGSWCYSKVSCELSDRGKPYVGCKLAGTDAGR
jgi:hypothetical protein